MKKFKLLFSALLIFYSAYASANLPDWGRADTLERYSVGPGAIYTKIQFPEYPLYIYLTEIDLTNEHTKIEQVQSNGIVPDTRRETTLNQSIRNTSKGHRVYCATNHDFFTFDTGICIGMNTNDGEVPYSTGWGRSMIAFDKDKTASVFHPKPSTTVKLTDNTTVGVDVFNTNPADGYQGVLYNKYNARNISGDGIFIKIQAEGEWSFNGPDIPCKVLEVSTTPIQSTKTEYVLHFRGAKATLVTGKVKANDVISISQKFLKSKFGTPGENIKTAFHGYPSIINEGKLHEGEYNNFENGREFEVSSRTMLGMSKDGKKIYIMVVDGRSRISKGINCMQMGEYMVNMGAWNVVNFDSGGSSTMVINNELANIPSDAGVQRNVMDTFQAISTAPESDEVESYTFNRPSIAPLRNTSTKLEIFSHNKYGEVLEKDVKGFTYKCFPTSLGTVDANGNFLASNIETSGYVEAEKDGLKTQIRVNIQPIKSIKFSFHKALLDNIDELGFDIIGSLNEKSQTVDPSALTWTNSNPEICTFDNGILKGLKEGEAQIIGQLDNLQDTLNVKVEIGRDSIGIENFNDKASFKVSSDSQGINNINNTDTESPSGWADGMTISVDLSSGRFPTMDMTKNIPIYGIPDSLTILVKASNPFLKNITFYIKGISGTEWLYETAALDFSKEQLISIKANKNHNSDFSIPASEFPISLQKTIFYFKNISKKSSEKIWIRDLRAYYPNKSASSSIEIDEMNNFGYNLVINEDIAKLEYVLSEDATIAMSLYKVNGSKVTDITGGYKLAGEHSQTFGIDTLSKGVYIIQVMINEQSKAIKFIK